MVEQSDLDSEWVFAQTDADLKRAVEIVDSGYGPVGVDTERASGFRYGDSAYLVQVSRRGAGTFLFDPTGIQSFDPLAEVLSDAEWIIHAASQDIPSLAELGLRPQRLFDTELAARLLGHDRVGLGALVEELLGIRLDKAHSAADWSTRPLPLPWLEYAALDVALLPDLRDAIAAEVVEQGKEDIVDQEFQAARSLTPKPADEERWRRTSGGHKLKSARELAIVRELWRARDDLARKRDVAPGRLIPDSAIVAAAAAAPRSKNDLARLSTFRGRASRTELDRWWRAILLGKTTEELPPLRVLDADAIPHHRSWARRYPEAANRLSAARELVGEEADQLGMPLENLLSPRHLRRLAWQPPAELTERAVDDMLRELGAREWQRSRTSPLIVRAFVESD